jgi:3-methyl-2-oxobutanoate hydroxymethyltransferase
MSVQARQRRVTVPEIASAKGQAPLACLTAYTAPMAKLLDSHVELLLVGDSLGMVVYGLDSTVGVTLDMMIAHGAAVVRATRHACIVVDLPFGSYEESIEQATHNAVRILKETGCAAVKLEGGIEMADTIRHLTSRGIPVMGHVGLMPQRANAVGGFKVQGRGDSGGTAVVRDAHAVAEAGAFSVVIEAVPEPVGREATAAVAVPTIGIGASPGCDGQILVTEDMLGLFPDFTPKFVKRFASLGGEVESAAAAYATAVRDRSFPAAENLFGAKSG